MEATAPESGLSSLVMGDQIVATCANSTNPICYNTAVSGSNIVAGLWFSAILGALCFLGFVIFRTKFRLYYIRLEMAQVTHKPPQMRTDGLHRIWSWLTPVFRVSDDDLLASAGLDALVATRIISFGIWLFLPMTILAAATLIPINYTDDYYSKEAEQENFEDEYTTVFIRLTMSNLTPGSNLIWVHFVYVFAAVGWACWLITEHYKEYIALRQSYVIRSTEVPIGLDGNPLTGSIKLKVQSTFAPENHQEHMNESQEYQQQFQSNAAAMLLPHNTSGTETHDNSNNKGSSPAGLSQGLLHGVPGGEPNRALIHLHRRDASRASEGLNASAAAQPSSRFGRESSKSLQLADRSKSNLNTNTNAAAGGGHHAQPPAEAGQLPPPLQSLRGSTSASRLSTLATNKSLNGVNLAGSHHSSGTSSVEYQQQQQQQHQRHSKGNSGADTSSQQTADWTQYDFSNDITMMDLPTTTEVAAAAAAAAAALPPLSNVNVPHFPRASVGNPQLPNSGLRRQVSSFGSGQRTSELYRTSTPASAAVAAALDDHKITSAAEALVKIRHHRQLSGASNGNTPAASTSATPTANTPRLGWEGEALMAPENNNPSDEGAGGTTAVDGVVVGQPPPPHLVVQAIQRLKSGVNGSSGGKRPDLSINVDTQSTSSEVVTSTRTDGITRRWWKAVAMGGRACTPISTDILASHFSEQDDAIYRGVVVRQQDDGSLVAANANLYTVLVTDQPMERLRLGRSIGDQQLGSQLTRKLTNALRITDPHQDYRADNGTAALGSGGSSSHSMVRGSSFTSHNGNNNIISSSSSYLSGSGHQNNHNRNLHDVEANHTRGVSMDEDAVTAMATSEPGIFGSSGWITTWDGLRQWWKHRKRYSEWRRDVRWSMFNRRVRTATEMFTELFGADFDAIIPIYATEPVDKLLHKWDAAAARLERLDFDLKHETRSHKKASLQAKIDKINDKITVLQKEICDTRDELLSDLPSTCFFATFKSQEAAAIAAQANLNPINQRLFKVQAAPAPDDVNWPALTRSWWQRQSRPLYVLPLILLIMLFPIGAFTGAFAQLTIAICGNPIDGSAGPGADSWFCSSDPWAVFFRNLLTSVVPSLLLSIYHMCVLPVLVYYAAQAEGQCFSLSELDRRCADLFFYWDVFNVFLGAMLGGSVLAELDNYLNHPSEIWQTLASAIPASSNFFINYVAYRALVMAWFRLFYPHMAIISSLVKWAHIIPWAKTPREKAMEMPVRNCRYGRDIGIPVLMNFVMVMAYAVVSPLILPFGLLYFIFLWPVWRYQMLYVYQRTYESGGQLWPFVAHKLVWCLFIMVVFTGLVFIFKAAYTQAILLLVILPIYLLRFDTYLKMRYDAVVEQVPLMAVHAAATRVESINPHLWTPPPLRPKAEGWHIEYGKVWQFWGIPRYTL